MKRFAYIALLALAACSVTPTTPQQAVFQAKSNYETALSVAVIYDNLPACTTGGSLLCSTHATKVSIKKAKDVASVAIDSAEDAVRNPQFDASTTGAVIASANAAVAALTAITAILKVK